MTDKERIEILKKAKRRIEVGVETYICNAITYELKKRRYCIFSKDEYGRDIDRVMRIFPELKKLRPKGKGVHDGRGWWNFTEDRINAVNSMITEIKDNGI